MVFNAKNSQILVPLKKNWVHSSSGYFGQSDSYNSSEDEDDDYEDYDDDEEDDDDDDEKNLYFNLLRHDKKSYDVIKSKEHNAINWVLEREAFCFDVKSFAEKFVEAIFIEANKALRQDEGSITFSSNVPTSQCDGILEFSERESLRKQSSGVKFKNILIEASVLYWPKISEFNIKLGSDKIANYVKQWKRSDDWKFYVEFLGFECEDCSNIFVYEVEWSKPTKEYPIPQATASVFFAMEVYKMIPPKYDRNIEVTYIFEYSSVIHHPGRINFQEKWLEDILEAKLKFFKTITFSVSNIFFTNGSLEQR